MKDEVKTVSLLLFALLVLFVVLVPPMVYAQMKTEVIIVSSGSPLINREIGKTLSAVLQEANKIDKDMGDINHVRKYCTPEGFAALKELVEKTGFFSAAQEYRNKIIETSSGKFEVRGIRVRVDMGETEGDDIEELVFVLNVRLFIDDIHFAMEEHHYQRLVDEGRKLDDMFKREHILNFLEEFRTAHNRKDIRYLEKAYSDDALIIVGKVLEEQKAGGDYLESSTLGQEKIRLIRLSKKEYIDRLRQVFKLNHFVCVEFEEVEIKIHGKYPDIYGIHVKQKWQSSTYNDEGYLFVMMDFKNPDKPVIHVRAWQPEKFEDGSVVAMGDFVIIDEPKN